MKTRFHSLSAVALASSLALLAGCAADSDADPITTNEQSQGLSVASASTSLTDPSLAIDPIVLEPADTNVSLVAAGSGWKQLHISGQLEDPTTGGTREANEDIVVLTSSDGIATAPLSDQTKARLTTETTSTATYYKTVSTDLITVVSLSAAAEVDAAEQSGVTYFASCSDYDSSYTRSVSVNRSFSFAKGNESGSFTGNINFNANVKGSASATARYRVHKSWCIPYKVSFKSVDLLGNADLTATAAVNGKFEKAWKYEKTIAKPEIASFSFWAGPVPVYFKIRVPVEVGVDAKAKAELSANAKVIGKGSFNVVCTSSSCSGTRSATLDWAQDTPPTVSVSAKVDVTPSVSAAIRGVLYGEDIAYGDVGVRGSLPGSLWGYYGNGCGDANNDGVNEWVNALTLDLRAKVDIFARVDTLFTDKKEWTWNVANKHIGFWSFGDDSALDPIFYSGGVSGTSVTMRGRMRPCWPYTESMRYRITWGDGSVETFDASPTTLFSKPHSFATYGSKTIKAEALYDTKGRDPNSSTTRSLYLRQFAFTDVYNKELTLLAR